MLAGLSIELLLKGILRGLTEAFPPHHRLAELVDAAGICIDDDGRIVLQALTEYVYWAAKYPAPRDESELAQAEAIFAQQRRETGNFTTRDIREREVSRENYVRLWSLFAGCFFQVQGSTFESAEIL